MRLSSAKKSRGVSATIAALILASPEVAQGQAAPTFKPGSPSSEDNTQYIMR